ncbi:MAG: hypothetical protein WCR59_03240 [Planctomycetota bacterium]
MLKFLLPMVIALSAAFDRTTASADCACHGCWSQVMAQVTCPNGGNPPLIVPTFQTATDNPCTVTEQGCGTANDPKKCKASAKVRVTFPGTPCRVSVWVQGGTAFPVPTQVNSTTVDTELTIEADCGKGSSTLFKVWYTDPGSAPGAADASHEFKLTCHACSNTDPCTDG